MLSAPRRAPVPARRRAETRVIETVPTLPVTCPHDAGQPFAASRSGRGTGTRYRVEQLRPARVPGAREPEAPLSGSPGTRSALPRRLRLPPPPSARRSGRPEAAPGPRRGHGQRSSKPPATVRSQRVVARFRRRRETPTDRRLPERPRGHSQAIDALSVTPYRFRRVVLGAGWRCMPGCLPSHSPVRRRAREHRSAGRWRRRDHG